MDLFKRSEKENEFFTEAQIKTAMEITRSKLSFEGFADTNNLVPAGDVDWYTLAHAGHIGLAALRYREEKENKCGFAEAYKTAKEEAAEKSKADKKEEK